MTRATIKPYKRDRYYWVRVPRINGVAEPRSLEVADVTVADDVCTFLVWLRNKGEKYLLDEMAAGRVKPLLAYHAWLEHKLDEFISTAKRGIDDPDLTPWIPKWQAELERLGIGSRTKYLTHVRTLMPEGKPFLRSMLTKPAIKLWLSERNSPNRYQASLSSFVEFLKEQDVVSHNVVRDIKYAKEAKPRERYLTPEDAKRVIDALDGEARAYHALAAATGMECQALANLKRRDIDLDAKTILARGEKTKHRTRTVAIYWRWEWAWEVFTGWLKTRSLLPDAGVFDKTYWMYYAALARATKSTGVSDYRTHDWRHTWGVQAIKDGWRYQEVASQLGHGSTQMAIQVYAKYVPTATDLANVRQNHTAIPEGKADAV